MTRILSANGAIEIPAEFRTADDLKPGQACDVERVSHGEYRVRVAEDAGRNWVEWLLACPEKGWFVEPERTEQTSLQPPTHFAE